MKLFTVGFVFDTTLEQVLLVHKLKPATQAGKLNGVGGKIEDGETAIECMVRECQEESALLIPAVDWKEYATIKDTNGTNPGAKIYVFAALYSGKMSDASKNDYEEVEWFPYNALPETIWRNLSFLVPMAREALQGHQAKVTIQY